MNAIKEQYGNDPLMPIQQAIYDFFKDNRPSTDIQCIHDCYAIAKKVSEVMGEKTEQEIDAGIALTWPVIDGSGKIRPGDVRPCPFCGESENIHLIKGENNVYTVRCCAGMKLPGCGADCGWERTKEEAFIKWEGDMPRGGKREGAGRPEGTGPYGEKTIPMRIPGSRAQEVRAYLDKGRPTVPDFFSDILRKLEYSAGQCELWEDCDHDASMAAIEFRALAMKLKDWMDKK